jgi:hypothetical protein
MRTLSIHIDHLRQFSADGQVYRAFHSLIVARMGALLLVPMHLVTGRIDTVVDGCPVPWEEVYAVLEYPVRPQMGEVRGELFKRLQMLAQVGIDPADCDMDHISPMVMGRESVLRLVHSSGVRFAVAM